MNRYCLVVVGGLLAGWGVTSAGFAQSVATNDLAPLSDEQLEQLKETEFAVLKAQVALARSQALATSMKTELKAAKEKLDVESLDLKAAKSESKAAQANVDIGAPAQPAVDPSAPAPTQGDRLRAANDKLSSAQRDYDTVKALVAWKEAALDQQQLDSESAENKLALAELKRDRARLAALQSAAAATTAKYRAGDLDSKLAKAQQRLDKVEVKRSTATTKAEQAKRTYEARTSAAPSDGGGN